MKSGLKRKLDVVISILEVIYNPCRSRAPFHPFPLSRRGNLNNLILVSFLSDKSLGDTSDIISDSSGVGTSNSDTTNPSITLPGTTVVCIESYNSGLPGHLIISQGDILEGLFKRLLLKTNWKSFIGKLCVVDSFYNNCGGD